MKQTAKYRKACEVLTYPHTNQDELYSELNRLGWYWNSENKQWIRDLTPPNPTTNLIRVRVWAAKEKVSNAAELFIENAETNGLRLLEKSEPYPCRPPNQNESRIYLTFEDMDN